MRILLFLVLLLYPAFLPAQTIHIYIPHDTICHGTPAHFVATDSGVSSPHFKWKVNGSNTGTDSVAYTSSTLNNGDSIQCLLINSIGDTVFAVSNKIGLTVQTFPNAGTISGPDSVCVGRSILLVDTTPGGTWSTRHAYATVSAGLVTGTSIPYVSRFGIDTISYSISNSCGSDSAFKKVVVAPVLKAYFYLTSGMYSGKICVGETQTVNEYSDNGYSGTLYSLHGNTHCGFQYVTGLSPGSDIIMGVTSNYCGNDTFYYPVQVVGLPDSPTAFISRNNICPGDTALLTAAAPGASYVKWWAGNLNARVDYNSGSFIVTGISTGTDIIYLQGTYECGHMITTTTVNILPPMPISGKDTLCQGDKIVLIDSSSGGTWSAISNTIDTHSGHFEATLPGIATVAYTLPSGCHVTKDIIINPAPPPISGADNLCIGDKLQLTASGNGAWSTHDSSLITLDQYGDVSGLKEGIAKITYTISTGCHDSTFVHVLDCKREFFLFPNPSRYEVTIVADAGSYNHLSVINCVGQKVYEQDINETITTFNVQSFTPGVYVIFLTGDSHTHISKFVRE